MTIITHIILLFLSTTVAIELHVGKCPNCNFTTLHAARDHLRQYHSDDASPSINIVNIHQGAYPPLILDSMHDSFTTWQGYDAANPPIISAGVPVPASLWSPSPIKGSQIISTNYTALNITYGGGLPTNGGAIDTCDQQTLQKTELFHGDGTLHDQPILARYPNTNNNNWQFLHAVSPSKNPAGAITGFIPATKDQQRVEKWIATEEAPYVQGYWAWDWADSIASINNVTSKHGISFTAGSKGPQVKPNARYVGINLLSELDVPGEYYISNTTGMIHYIPHVPLNEWKTAPVLSTNTAALVIDNQINVTISNMIIAHALSTGLSAINVSNVMISNVNVYGHGAIGIDLNGLDSTIKDSNITDIGCKGMNVYCGDMYTMENGNCLVDNNYISRFAKYKRTYQPGIHWGGVKNMFSRNTITNGAHNCILGGGNEAKQGGVNTIFEYNTLDTCAFEASDTGAFYSCGQQATAMVNPGNIVRHSSFKNVINTGGSGVQGITIQAIYLDDQMSSWNVYNNTFKNCTTGTFVGGGRLNNISNNYYEDVGVAHHFDNRGMGWEKSGLINCTCTKAPMGGCECDPGAVKYEANGPAGAIWKKEFGVLMKTLTDVNCGTDKLGLIPCYNVVSNNMYCRTKTFCDASQSSIESWHSVAENNVEKCH